MAFNKNCTLNSIQPKSTYEVYIGSLHRNYLVINALNYFDHKIFWIIKLNAIVHLGFVQLSN